MDDLISREAAIKAIERDAYRHTYLDQILDIIKSMPSVQPEPLTHRVNLELTKEELDKLMHDMRDAPVVLLPSVQPERWIPCSERLPELDESVLATTAWDDITIAWRIGISKWFIHEGNTNAETDDVLAWMPLPELYKGE